MCAVIQQNHNPQAVADAALAWDAIVASDDDGFGPATSGNCHRPGKPLWALRWHAGRRHRRFDRLIWGLVPPWSVPSDMAAGVNHARWETIADKPLFRDAWAKRQRCAIPADRFFEWRRAVPRQQFHAVGASDGGPLLIAGLWTATRTGSGGIDRHLAVITLPASPALAALHPRMPALLRPDGLEPWLAAGAIDLTSQILRPSGSDDLSLAPVDPAQIRHRPRLPVATLL
jgi:putative SOS response-associated peptidase YedK